MKIVLDTSVLIAAMRSNQSASYAIIRALPSDAFTCCHSIPLYMAWQAVLTRSEHWPPGRSAQDAIAFLRYLASISHLQALHYLWRPVLRDSNDDTVLELAVAARASYIVTHHTKNFQRAAVLGVEPITPITPAQFIQLLTLPQSAP
jgi:putative PIN family toxin of toxin-antitoxin system